jgi:predicted dehydrogenase
VSDRLRVALVGAGLAARSHALDVITDDSLELVGVAGTSSPSTADLADTFGGVVYPDIDALLDDPTIDGVIVAVPPRAVFGVLDRVAEAAKPCLAEKPVAASRKQIRRLENLIRRHAPIAAPFNRRYQSHVQQAASAARTLGEITEVQASWSGPFRARFEEGSSTYRASAQRREGVITDSGTHALDAISLLVGGLAAATVKTATLVCNERGADVEGRFVFSTGPATVEVALTDAPVGPDCGEWQIRLLGSKARLHLDEHRCVIEDPHGIRQVTPTRPMDRPVSDLHALAAGRNPVGTALGEVLAISKLVSAIYDVAFPEQSVWLRPRGKALGRLNGAC